MSSPMHIVTVAGYVEDGKGNVLLVKTNFRGWENPGGQVEVGENLEEALKREIREESGAEVSIRCLLAVYSNTQISIWHDGVTQIPTIVTFDFICDYTGGCLRTSDETCDVKWVPKDHILSMIKHPVFIHKAKTYMAYDGKVIYAAYTKYPDFLENYI